MNNHREDIGTPPSSAPEFTTNHFTHSTTSERATSSEERQTDELRDGNLNSSGPRLEHNSNSFYSASNDSVNSGTNRQTDDDDEMPALQSVSDFDDSEMDARITFTRETNSASTIPALAPRPGFAPRGERRPRVEDVEDEDDVRPRRRQRLNSVGTPETSQDTPMLNTPNPVPSRGIGEIGMVFTFDGAGRPIASFPLGFPPPPPIQGTSLPTEQLPSGNNGSRNLPPEDHATLLRNFQAFTRAMSGFLSMEEERDDPDRARKLVAGMEEVPYGLVRRMERIGGPSAEDTNASESPTCAICWDTLLDPEGDGFTVPDTNSSQTSPGGNITGDRSNHNAEPADVTRTTIHSGASSNGASVLDAPRSPPTIVVLPCSHVFHAPCLVPWFARPKHTTCPTCRFDVDPDNITRKTTRTPRFIPTDLHPTPSGGPSNSVATPAPDHQNSLTPSGHPNPLPSTHGTTLTDGLTAVNNTAQRTGPTEARSTVNQSPPGTNNGFFVDVSFTVEPLPSTDGSPQLRPNVPTPVPGVQHAASATEGNTNETGAGNPSGLVPDIRGILTRIVSRAIAESFTAALGGVAINGNPPPEGTTLARNSATSPGVGAITTENDSIPRAIVPPFHSANTSQDAPPTAVPNGTEGAQPMVFGPFMLGRTPSGGMGLPPRLPPTIFGAQGGGLPIQLAFPFNIPTDLPTDQRSAAGAETTPHNPSREWSPPPAPGLTLRQRVEKRERELGLRCWDISCGVGPSDDEPCPPSSANSHKQIAVRSALNSDVPVCEHRFHPACLVVSDRISGGLHLDEPDKHVSVTCSICRASGIVIRDQWDEGVCVLSE